MPISTHDVRQALLASDPEFQRLVEEHSRCESQLEEITRDPHVNSEVLLEEITLKKIKLRLKDQMEMMVARHQRQSAHS
jgi:uncharacterized protein YdcH (DUF465 family)